MSSVAAEQGKRPMSGNAVLEREWVTPGLALTFASSAFAIMFVPNPQGLIPALNILPAWLAAATITVSIYGLILAGMRGVDKPLAELRKLGLVNVAALFLAFTLTGLNMIAFMWMKPLLNYLVPFTADPLLADLDYLLFFGNDPFKLLAWLNFPYSGIVYHQTWFVMIILCLTIVIASPKSRERSALLMTYFTLWSVIAPVMHTMLPAAGPIFFERMGYGDRFATLAPGPETMQVADYLWAIYSMKTFGAGSGISAMPSMHIAMTSWVLLVIWTLSRRLLVPGLIGATIIYLLSISLGWHYAVDGIVAAACAFGCYHFFLRVYKGKPRHSEIAGQQPAIANQPGFAPPAP